LLKGALVCTIEVIKWTIKQATSLVIRTLKIILRWRWRHILHYLLHQELRWTCKHRVSLLILIFHAVVSLMLYTSLYMLLNGTVLDFDRIDKLLNHLVFLLSCMLIQNFIGQMLPRGLLYIVAKERSFIFRVTHLDWWFLRKRPIFFFFLVGGGCETVN
jgi:hypothetical protein